MKLPGSEDAIIDMASFRTVVGISDIYGTRFIIDFELQWIEKVAIIRSSWIIRTSETSPRFLTCYVL
jgi:hypothetical protein